jgi:hypothetical protein
MADAAAPPAASGTAPGTAHHSPGASASTPVRSHPWARSTVTTGREAPPVGDACRRLGGAKACRLLNAALSVAPASSSRRNSAAPTIKSKKLSRSLSANLPMRRIEAPPRTETTWAGLGGRHERHAAAAASVEPQRTRVSLRLETCGCSLTTIRFGATLRAAEDQGLPLDVFTVAAVKARI